MLAGKLVADDGVGDDRFGISVAVGDGVVVVGAPAADDDALAARARIPRCGKRAVGAGE